jgi:membrane protease YdiL (CAAX protease family)
MKGSLYNVIFIDSLFFVMLALSGSLTGVLSEVVYYLAFAIPIFLGFFAIRRGACHENVRFSKIKREGVTLSAALLFPTVALVLCISCITDAVLGPSFATASPVTEDNILVALILHALLPAVLEEILFRYIPIRLLSGHSPRYAILISALLFSAVHHTVRAIPYAFVAGVIFALVDVATKSIYPSLVFHFVNNAISVALVFYANVPAVLIPLVSVLALFAVISLAVIVAKRKDFRSLIRPATSPGTGYDGGLAPAVLLIPAAAIALLEIYSVIFGA